MGGSGPVREDSFETLGLANGGYHRKRLLEGLERSIGAVHKAFALLPQRSEDKVVRRIRPRE